MRPPSWPLSGLAIAALSLTAITLGQDNPSPPRGPDDGVRSRFVDSAGRRLHVLEAGPEGTTALLLLHGGRFEAQTWRTLGTLQRIAARGHRVLALDLPGFGQSESSTAPLDWEAVLNALEVEQAVVLSPSMSGRFSFPLLEQHPERLAGFIAVAPVGIADLATRLRDCPVPALMLWGENDQVIPPSQADVLAKCFLDVEKHELSGASHPCYLDAPKRFHAILETFLDRCLNGTSPHPAAPPLPVDDLPADLGERPLPPGFPEPLAAPEGNEHTAERFALGRRLFFDPILSADHQVSCASCHQPEHGFSVPEALPRGVHGERCNRNAPTLFNRAFSSAQMWDGRVEGLEAQVLMPVEAPNEMGLPLSEATRRLRDHAEYPALFQLAYGGAPDERNLSFALAAFVRRLWSGDSPVDRFRSADVRFLNTEAKQGLWVFESRGGCWRCHSGPNFSDEQFHNTGVGVRDGIPEAGRFGHTADPADTGKFRTPSLRFLRHTAPYMHDGSIQSLEKVIEFYRRGGNENPHRDPKIQPLKLSDEDAAHLVAFLRALSDSVEVDADRDAGKEKKSKEMAPR